MAEDPIKMLGRVIGTRLDGATGAGTRVHLHEMPEKITRPYVLVTFPSASERNWHVRVSDPDVIVQVKAVATSKGDALDIRQQCIELLDDQGEQDLGGLSGGADWHILKAKVEKRMSIPYSVGTTKVYEEIFQIRICLQER